MNYELITPEVLVVLLGLGVLLADLWIAPESRRGLGWLTASLLGCILALSLGAIAPADGSAFGGMFVLDSLARYFKGFFLFGGILVLLMTVEFSHRLKVGLSEFYALTLFALAGMMFAASANDFTMMFVSLELITVTFYILNSFQRSRLLSLEAGVKYLILGGVASAFMVFGIALIFGSANSTNFSVIAAQQGALSGSPVFLSGLLLVLVGLGFKIAAFPFQIWAPDVYQGSPAPATAFLSVGSKAAGFVLLLRVLYGAIPQIAADWQRLFAVISGITILYGSLCALPQRNLKRLLGYSSIANAGYLLLGVAAGSQTGTGAVLFYIGGYFFTVLAAFTVICAVSKEIEGDEITSFNGLGVRSPLLAAALTIAMVSLAGIPPMVGFFGKFQLLASVLEAARTQPAFYVLLGVAVVGVVLSLYYYFGVIRAVYWGEAPAGASKIGTSMAARVALCVCIIGILFLGIMPGSLMRVADGAAAGLSFAPSKWVPTAAVAAH